MSSTGLAPWRAALHRARSGLGLFVTLIVSIVLDARLRFWLLPRYRKDEAGRIDAVNRIIRAWGVIGFWLGRTSLGLKVVVEGKPPASGRYLIVSNHQSSMDIPLIFTIFRALNVKFVAMEELRYGKPGVSLALRNGGFAFVAKRKVGEDLATLKRFGRQMERFDGSPAIFPEGRRTDDGFLRPFNFAGIEVVRRTSKLPLLPITIDGLWRARDIKDYHRLVGCRVTVRICEPIPFEDVERLGHRKAYREIEETIRRNLDEIRKETGPKVGEGRIESYAPREAEVYRESK